MAYVITDSCIKDSLCVDVCPTDCIHPKKDEPQFEAATQLYVDPEGCIDCGACVPVCTSDSLHPIADLSENPSSPRMRSFSLTESSRQFDSSPKSPPLTSRVLEHYRLFGRQP